MIKVETSSATFIFDLNMENANLYLNISRKVFLLTILFSCETIILFFYSFYLITKPNCADGSTHATQQYLLSPSACFHSGNLSSLL